MIDRSLDGGVLGRAPMVVVVGSGGVGKTTLAAALALQHARSGHDSLVMTFDPSLRLKDALGVGEEALDREVRVETDTPGRLDASLLDARKTFDRLVDRYAPDPAARDRILNNRFYDRLAGNLGGILEYMAVERLFEVAAEDRYARVVLDTPPTRQALDFLEAPDRIVAFLESGALRIALKDWFDDEGHLRVTSWFGVLGRGVESFFDRTVGLTLLRDMAEFFQAFGPLFEGFRRRAGKVQELLRSPDTLFLLVSGPGEERLPDTMFFARKLVESGHNLGPIVVNQVHPTVEHPSADPEATGPSGEGSRAEAVRLLRWLGDRDARGLRETENLVGDRGLIALPLLDSAPNDLDGLEDIGARLLHEAARL